MVKKILKIIVSAIICISTLVGCGDIVNYYDRIDTAIEMSECAMELYSEGKLGIAEKISKSNVSDYCDENSRLSEILNSDNEFGDYCVIIINDDIALVKTNEIFGEAEGFIVNFGEEALGDTYTVPEELGFDGNTLSLITVDDYSNVYTFRAKL